MLNRSAIGGLSILGRFLRLGKEVVNMKVFVAVAILSLASMLAACARARSGAQVKDSTADDYYKNHGVIWRIFHPRVIAGRPLWQKALYWIGPGHCPFCRGALYATTRFDDWPSPYCDLSGKPESAKAPEK